MIGNDLLKINYKEYTTKNPFSGLGSNRKMWKLDIGIDVETIIGSSMWKATN